MRHPLSLLLLLVALAACRAPLSQDRNTASPEAPVARDWRADFRGGEGLVYRLDPAQSQVRIYAFRGGAAARAGHNHVLDAPRFEGYVRVPGETVAAASFELRLRLDELRIDDPALRQETGGSFSGERSAADIEGTRRNLLGKRGLAADAHPEVVIRSHRLAGDWPVLVADVEIVLHGQTRILPVLLQVERSPQRLRVRGELVLRQTDFGVQPFSLLGGVLSVQDAVAVRFDLVGQPGAPA
ncbi:MAG TPA: YceI family protein [Solimonas sp.]|nr:YceI family protein [Solimonas sp.]